MHDLGAGNAPEPDHGHFDQPGLDLADKFRVLLDAIYQNDVISVNCLLIRKHGKAFDLRDFNRLKPLVDDGAHGIGIDAQVFENLHLAPGGTAAVTGHRQRSTSAIASTPRLPAVTTTVWPAATGPSKFVRSSSRVTAACASGLVSVSKLWSNT
jgi:hypothetical protein